MLFRYAALSLAAFAALPALAQQPARTHASAEAAAETDVVGDLIETARRDEAAEAADAAPAAAAAPRVGLTVRAATGAPVGQVAAVTDEGVILRMQVKDRPVLKLLKAERLELKGDAAVTDLTLSELQRLPDAVQAGE